MAENTDNINTADSEVSRGFVQCLRQNFDRQLFTDFTVRVGHQEFKCHKVVLSACSDFFAGLLRSDMRENAENVARIEGVRPEIFALILDAIYKGQNILSVDNMLEIWHATNQLQIGFLLKLCEEFIVKNISQDNFVDIYKNAKLLDSQPVLQVVFQTMVANFGIFTASSTFPQISVDDLLAVISSGRQTLCTDIAVKAVLNWVGGEKSDYADKALRQEYLGRLLKSVDLQTASTSCLRLLMTSDIVLGCKEAVATVCSEAVQRLNSERVGGDRKQPLCLNLNCAMHQSQLTVTRRQLNLFRLRGRPIPLPASDCRIDEY